VHETLKTVCRMITTERERLKRAVEQDSSLSPMPSGATYVQTLKQTLAEVTRAKLNTVLLLLISCLA